MYGKNWKFQDRLFSEEQMYAFIENTAKAKQLWQTGRALILMKEYHAGQFRKGKDRVPYINHPLTMACHALALGIDEDEILAAILLHDVVEDCGVTAEELEVGDAVREAISLLTFSKGEGLTRQEAKKQYFQRIAEDRIASLVKVLDRCHNVSTMVTGFTKEKMASYIEETETFLFPILENLNQNYPELQNVVFLLEYQMKSVLEAVKRLL